MCIESDYKVSVGGGGSGGTCGLIRLNIVYYKPSSSDGKESACNAGDLGSFPESGRSPREGNGYPFRYSYLENSTDRGACWITVHGVPKSQATQLVD